MENQNLFSGKPRPLGGLSNEKELAKMCPQEFKEHSNAWRKYARELFFNGADISNWKWRSEKHEEKQKQISCLCAVLATFDLPHEDKEAVAGWMLSEMLNETPEHLPNKSVRG